MMWVVSLLHLLPVGLCWTGMCLKAVATWLWAGTSKIVSQNLFLFIIYLLCFAIVMKSDSSSRTYFPGTAWESLVAWKIWLACLSFVCGRFVCPWRFISLNIFTLVSVQSWQRVEINSESRVTSCLPTFQYLFFWDMDPCSPGWPLSGSSGYPKDDLELLILPSSGSTEAPSCPTYVMLGITSWAVIHT